MINLKHYSIALMTIASVATPAMVNAAETFQGVRCSGTAVTTLQDGQKYLIYDAYADDGTDTEQTGSETCRYAFRYDAGGSVYGTHIKPANAQALTLNHIWIASVTTSTTDDGETTTYSFKNEATGQWMTTTTANAQQATSSDETQKGTFTFEENSDGTLKVSSTATQWDGNGASASYSMVGWTGSGHPYKFYTVSDEDYTTCYTPSANFVWNGQTISSVEYSALMVGKSLTIYGDNEITSENSPLTITLDGDVQPIYIKNIRRSQYVGTNGATLNQNGNGTAAANLFIQDGDKSA